MKDWKFRRLAPLRLARQRMVIGIGFFISICLTSSCFAQGAPAQTTARSGSQPGYYRMPFGRFTITALSDGTVPLPVSQLLLNTTPAQVKQLLAREYLQEPLEISINAYLIDTGARRILLDTGAGGLFGPDNGGRLLTSLRAAGYEPSQIDAVLLTHIHGDHSGGLTQGQQLTFPNAFVYVEQREADFWLTPANEAKVAAHHRHSFPEAEAAVRPVVAAGRLRHFRGQTELFPGIEAVPSAGHSPGHSFYVVRSQGQQLVFWGDAMHVAAAQFPYPGIAISYDVDPAAATAVRQRAYAEAAREGYWVAVDHVSFPGIGHVRANGTGYDWVPINYSQKP